MLYNLNPLNQRPGHTHTLCNTCVRGGKSTSSGGVQLPPTRRGGGGRGGGRINPFDGAGRNLIPHAHSGWERQGKAEEGGEGSGGGGGGAMRKWCVVSALEYFVR
jgi:hypothetical protein